MRRFHSKIICSCSKKGTIFFRSICILQIFLITTPNFFPVHCYAYTHMYTYKHVSSDVEGKVAKTVRRKQKREKKKCVKNNVFSRAISVYTRNTYLFINVTRGELAVIMLALSSTRLHHEKPCKYGLLNIINIIHTHEQTHANIHHETRTCSTHTHTCP